MHKTQQFERLQSPRQITTLPTPRDKLGSPTKKMMIDDARVMALKAGVMTLGAFSRRPSKALCDSPLDFQKQKLGARKGTSDMRYEQSSRLENSEKT